MTTRPPSSARRLPRAHRHGAAWLSALLAGLALAANPALAETAPKVTAIEPPQRILFVGNSYTYYNNSLHAYLRRMLEAADPGTERELRALTLSGARLAEHAGGLAQLVTAGRWDVVVLQGQSREPINAGRREFRDAARLFARHIRGSGAEPVLFMTWANEDRPEMTAELDDAYTALGNQLEALVVPVGPAFARAAAERPGLALRRDDGRHPTLAGTYLAAAVFYRALYPQLPAASAYTSTLGEDTAAFLQRIAAETVREYHGR